MFTCYVCQTCYGGGTYNKGERLPVKFSFTPLGHKTSQLEKAAQGVAQCEVSATRVVVDAAFRRIGMSRHGGHKIANISVNCQRI